MPRKKPGAKVAPVKTAARKKTTRSSKAGALPSTQPGHEGEEMQAWERGHSLEVSTEDDKDNEEPAE